MMRPASRICQPSRAGGFARAVYRPATRRCGLSDSDVGIGQSPPIAAGIRGASAGDVRRTVPSELTTSICSRERRTAASSTHSQPARSRNSSSETPSRSRIEVTACAAAGFRRTRSRPIASRFAARSARRPTSCHLLADQAPSVWMGVSDHVEPRGARSVPAVARANSVASGVLIPGARARSPSHSASSIGAGRGRSRTARRIEAAPPPPASVLTEHIRGERGTRLRSCVERSSTQTGHHGASVNRSRSSSAVAGRSARSARRIDPRGGRPSPSRRTCMNGGAVTYSARRFMGSKLRLEARICTTRGCARRSPDSRRPTQHVKNQTDKRCALFSLDGRMPIVSRIPPTDYWTSVLYGILRH